MVVILLSAYNGEQFLREQLDSLLSQSYTDWIAKIRDDGSSDGTPEIMREYEASYPEKFSIDKSVKTNLGAGKSFMHLLEITDSDYFMFCDQDDVWMKDKIEKTLKKIQDIESKVGKDTPMGVFTDLTVVDENLNTIMPSLWQGDNRHPEYVRDFYKQWINRHATYGCTMMINRAAKNIVLPFKQFEGVMGAHDAWIEYILIKQGIYDYIDEPTIYYRQHGTNVIGANMGITYKDEVNGIMSHPILLINKIIKDYKRTKQLPFKISFPKILWYRIAQSVKALVN